MIVRTCGSVLALVITAAAPAVSADPEFVIQIKNHQFIPAELRIPADVKVQILIDNQDDASEEFESYVLNREKHIPPRSKIAMFVGPLTAGRYVYQGEDMPDGSTEIGVIEAR